MLSQMLLPFRVTMVSSTQKGLLTYRRAKGNLFLIPSLYKLTLVLRYINTDYAIMSTLTIDIKAGITDIIVMYVIGCQWGKNLS